MNLPGFHICICVMPGCKSICVCGYVCSGQRQVCMCGCMPVSVCDCVCGGEGHMCMCACIPVNVRLCELYDIWMKFLVWCLVPKY